jgi:hypothetical protein
VISAARHQQGVVVFARCRRRSWGPSWREYSILSVPHDLAAHQLPNQLFQKNVLVVTKPKVKAVIADFGYSLCDGEQEVLASPRISCIEGYRAPELASLLEWPSRASDVFACASTFVELLYGQQLGAPSYSPPFNFNSISTGRRAISAQQWPQWESLIQSMWCGRRRERPTAHGVQKELARLIKAGDKRPRKVTSTLRVS